VKIDLDSILSEFSSTKTDPSHAFEVLKRVGRALGYDHAIAAFAPKTGDQSSMFLANTYSAVWHDEQSRLSVADALRDPIVTHLRTRVDPIFWSKENYDRVGQSAAYTRFREMGLGSGIALAVRGPNGEVLSVGLSNPEQIKEDASVPVMQMGALFLSATAMFNGISKRAQGEFKKELIADPLPRSSAYSGRVTAKLAGRLHAFSASRKPLQSSI
jgi:Autoinducer binding domain